MKKRYFIAGIFTGLIIQATHHVWLGTHSDKYFDLFILLIILICSFLLGVKITSYLANFKNIKEKSRIEIIFLGIFFILAIIPALYINKDEKSESENRMLATYKPLISNDRLNTSYGKDFESYFNDRFYLRNSFISNYHLGKALISFDHYETNDIFYIKKYQAIYLKKHIPSNNLLTQNEINNAIKSLDKLNNFCNTNNIKLYVLIVPFNQHIYQNYTKPFDDIKGLNQLNNQINQIKNISNAKIIYPYNELKQASKKEMTYFKTDHHWTDYGAFIGYQCLINNIKQDKFNFIPVNSNSFNFKYNYLVRSDFERRYYCGHQLITAGKFLKPLHKQILKTKYKYFYHKNNHLLKEKFIDNEYKKSRETYYPLGADYKIMELGTSMNENLLQFVSYTFKNVKYLRLNNVKNRKESEQFKIMKYYKKEILDYNPDIMILCITTLNVKHLNKIFDEE